MDVFTRSDYRFRHRGKRIGTIWIGKDEPDGDVTLTSNFMNEDPVIKLDILKDVIKFLEEEYDKSLEDFRKIYGKQSIKNLRK